MMHTKVILSVHLPKAAGTTFLRLLQNALNAQSVLTDYADDPCDPCSQRNLDPDGYFARPKALPIGCRAVHGHFHIHKYATTQNAFRLTFLRDPVDTLLSIHFYWQTLGRGRNKLHDYFLDQQLNVFQTAKLPMLRYLLSRNYFQGVNMASFDFIGRFESFSEDLERLSSKIGLSFSSNIHLNQTLVEGNQQQEMAADPKVRARLRDILSDDVAFFEAATR